MIKELSIVSKKLAIETHERGVLEKDLLELEEQLNKIKRDKDKERESYIINIKELERAFRLATKEQNKYRIQIEDLREHISGLESELKNEIGVVEEQKQLLKTLREELLRAENSRETRCSKIFPGNREVVLLQSENIISELRQEKKNAEDDLVHCHEHLEMILVLMEYSVSALGPDSGVSEGVFQLEKAIAHTRNYLGLNPAEEDEKVRE